MSKYILLYEWTSMGTTQTYNEIIEGDTKQGALDAWYRDEPTDGSVPILIGKLDGGHPLFTIVGQVTPTFTVGGAVKR